MPRIPIELIKVGMRERRLKRERISALAESIAEIGLQTPITALRAIQPLALDCQRLITSNVVRLQIAL